jgi:hypothetical protein
VTCGVQVMELEGRESRAVLNYLTGPLLERLRLALAGGPNGNGAGAFSPQVRMESVGLHENRAAPAIT